jgi:hypothetical protein
VLAALRAVGGYLDIESLPPLLTTLRAATSGERHLSYGEAVGVAASLGTIGGSFERPRDALRWGERLHAREKELAAQVTGAPDAATDRRDDPARMLEHIRRIRP